MNQSDILKEIMSIFKETLQEEDLGELSPDMELTELGMDSVNFVQLVVLLEKHFKIEFDDMSLNFYNYKTIGDVCYYIESKL